MLDSHSVATYDVRIKHMPQDHHGSRDLKIFEEQFGKSDSPLLPPRLHNQYARELFICGNDNEFLNSEGIFLKSLFNPEVSEANLKEALCVLVHIALLKKDLPALFKYSLKAVAMEGCSEILCDLGAYYLQQKDYEEAAVWYYNAAFESHAILNIKASKEIPLEGLIKTYEEMGHPEIAAQYRERLKKE